MYLCFYWFVRITVTGSVSIFTATTSLASSAPATDKCPEASRSFTSMRWHFHTWIHTDIHTHTHVQAQIHIHTNVAYILSSLSLSYDPHWSPHITVLCTEEVKILIPQESKLQRTVKSWQVTLEIYQLEFKCLFHSQTRTWSSFQPELGVHLTDTASRSAGLIQPEGCCAAPGKQLYLIIIQRNFIDSVGENAYF